MLYRKVKKIVASAATCDGNVRTLHRSYEEACDASPNLRELTVYFNKHIAANKLLSKKTKKGLWYNTKIRKRRFLYFPLREIEQEGKSCELR